MPALVSAISPMPSVSTEGNDPPPGVQLAQPATTQTPCATSVPLECLWTNVPPPAALPAPGVNSPEPVSSTVSPVASSPTSLPPARTVFWRICGRSKRTCNPSARRCCAELAGAKNVNAARVKPKIVRLAHLFMNIPPLLCSNLGDSSTAFAEFQGIPPTHAILVAV